MQREHTTRGDLHWAASAASTDLVGVHEFAASGSRGCEQVLPSHSQSLGASPLSFERAMKTAAVVFAVGSAVTFANDVTMAHALAPIDFEVGVEQRAVDSGIGLDVVAMDRAHAGSIRALVAAVDEEAVEDGVTHRAEILLASHIKQFGASGLAHYVVSATPAARSASLLRLFGRFPGIESVWRRFVVERCLASESVEVRDAAVQAVESWEDFALASLLRQHVEPVAWLSNYAQRVAADLEG